MVSSAPRFLALWSTISRIIHQIITIYQRLYVRFGLITGVWGVVMLGNKVERSYLIKTLVWFSVFLIFPLSVTAQVIPGFRGTITNQGNYTTPTLPRDTLPVWNSAIDGKATWSASPDGKLTITQLVDKAVVVWDSFNIGEDASVEFVQPDHIASILNKILDTDPSRILGNLKANGTVYLLNKNGFLFGPNANVNVYGLVASALDIADQDFKNSINKFNWVAPASASGHWAAEDRYGIVNTGVVNQGTIAASYGGKVWLLGPNVSNAGTIAVDSGDIVLASTDGQIEVSRTLWADRYVKYTGVPASGLSENAGSLFAMRGSVLVSGRDVQQDGFVEALGEVSQKARIELRATNSVTLGAGSLTLASLDAGLTQYNPSAFDSHIGGTVFIGGITKKYSDQFTSGEPKYHTKTEIDEIELKEVAVLGKISARSGLVSVQALNRIYLGSSSVIDVSGLEVEHSVADSLYTAQLNGVEMRDEFLQKDGLLRGQWISYFGLSGTKIGNVSANLASEAVTLTDAASVGGTIYFGGNFYKSYDKTG